MAKTTAVDFSMKTRVQIFLESWVFGISLVLFISLTGAAFLTISSTIGMSALLLFSSMIGTATRHWLPKLLNFLSNEPNSRPVNKWILVSEVDADIEILKGFNNDFYLSALALQIRLYNSSNQITHYQISSFQAEFFGMDEKWEYMPKVSGEIASNKSKVFSAKKMKLEKPIKVVSGITQIAGSLNLAFSYQDAEGTHKFQDLANHKITINTNNEGDSLKYRFEIS